MNALQYTDDIVNEEYLQHNYFSMNDFEIKTFEFEEVLKQACENTGFCEDEIKGKSKKHPLVMVRYAIFRHLKEQHNHSFGDIAFHFSRNKGNIHYGYNEALNMIETGYKPFIKTVNRIFNQNIES